MAALRLLLAFVLFAQYISAATAPKYVFAHVIVANTAVHTQKTWEGDIYSAQYYGIDVFALNIAYPPNPTQVANAFAAAEAMGFKLFFSFDYIAGSPWPATGTVSVVSYLNKYKSSSAYFLYETFPFVSCREGINNTGDWGGFGDIRTHVGSIYFVPDWTSLGTEGIVGNGPDLNGVFSWDMWPDGATNKTDATDLAWKNAIGGKTFMMGVSPWFWHTATDGEKSWLWRGDSLWADRWAQTVVVKPDFVQIVSWNDYANSHYIGPFHSQSDIPAGSSPFVNSHPHEGWLNLLPYYIAQYKGNASFPIGPDQLQFWYRTAPAAGGMTCGVVGNNNNQTQTQLSTAQTQISPNAIVEDLIFFTALLKAPGTITVTVGSYPKTTYHGVTGINHWTQPLRGQTGVPYFSVLRNGDEVNTASGEEITLKTPLSSGCTNYNAWVGGF